MKEPTRGLRLWVMIITGIVFIGLALVELIMTTFELYKTDRPFEEVTALLVFGFTVLWFSTPDQENAREMGVPHPPNMRQLPHEPLPPDQDPPDRKAAP